MHICSAQKCQNSVEMTSRDRNIDQDKTREFFFLIGQNKGFCLPVDVPECPERNL